jgi:rhomboid family GlyGly-CTERM serine protease
MIAICHPQFVSARGAPVRFLAAPAAWIIAALSIAFSFLPSVSEALQFDRAALAAGQWWRILTAHMTHWNAEHLVWDAAMFLILGAVLERQNRRQFILGIAAASVAISAAVWFLQPELNTYRGLSGVDTALFVMLSVGLLHDALSGQDRSRWAIAVPVLLLVALAGKLVGECVTGEAFFVNAENAGFVPVPLAHVVGAAVGLAVPLLSFGRGRRLPLTAP